MRPEPGEKQRPGSDTRTSEVETQLDRFRARRDVVGAAERGQEVVQRFLLVRLMTVKRRLHLYGRHGRKRSSSPTLVEQIARGDARWVVVVVLGPGSGILMSVEPYWDAGQRWNRG